MTRPGDRYRVGIDIGGTFTDFVLFDARRGQLRLHKCLTTPKDPSAGALEGWRSCCGRPASPARTSAIWCTAPRWSPTLSSSAAGPPSASSPRVASGTRWRWGSSSATTSTTCSCSSRSPWPRGPGAARSTSGIEPRRAVSRPLDLAGVRREVADLVAQGVEAVAVCFLHAYKKPGPRARRAEMIRREFPALAVSLSSEVVPELREYERGPRRRGQRLRAAADGPVRGQARRALAERGFRGRFYLMQSSGGMASAATARAFPDPAPRVGTGRRGLVTAFFGGQVGHATTSSRSTWGGPRPRPASSRTADPTSRP